MSLREHARQTGQGVAYADGMGFAIPELPSGRESFSPDAAYYLGPRPANRMRFVKGAPTLAVEVRSENDYGPSAETEMAAKRGDYFAAGTLVVWDVDPVAERIHVYRAADPDRADHLCPRPGRRGRAGRPGMEAPRRSLLHLRESRNEDLPLFQKATDRPPARLA